MNKNKNALIDKDLIRSNLLKYTRKAYKIIPPINAPRILDIGCGSGVPTIELARLSNGEIIAVDNDQKQLYLLNLKLADHNLQDRIKILKCSMFDLNFSPGSFDIIWSEGSIDFIGFERGIKKWRKFIKNDGFLVVHDDRSDLENKLEQIKQCGYNLKAHFILANDVWWKEYYEPLECKIKDHGAHYNNDPKILEQFKSEQNEIDIFKRDPGRFESVFFIMQKLTQFKHHSI